VNARLADALPDDPEKQRLRSLNAAAILLALDAIATRGFENANPAAYDSLPFNVGGASDLLIRGGRLVLPGHAPMLVDIAINYEESVARGDGRVREVGDLADVIAIDTLDVTGSYLHPGAEAVTATPLGVMLRIGAPARFDVRAGPADSSTLVRRIGDSGPSS
jgi:hypothetical protein